LTILPLFVFAQGNRWTLCAKEVCFTNELLRQFFANGKTLPIVRGGGVEQPVMRLAASLVS
jgi:monolysocardiolipin acyltransferase